MSISSKVLRLQALTNNSVDLLVRSLHKHTIQVAWQKPKIGWTKLNFDGSSKGKSGKASIGGVFRDHNAEFLLGYAESIGHTSSTMSEFVALRRGLDIARENGWNNLWLEGDSKTLVDLILLRRKVKCDQIQGQISHINEIIAGLDEYQLTHVYREGNKAADKLAKIGHRFSKPYIWRVSPPEIVSSILNDDADGKIVFRKKIS